MVCVKKAIGNLLIVAVGVFHSLAGCATSPNSVTKPTVQTACSRSEGALQEAQAQVQTLTSEMARIQIHAAKEEAELQSARQELVTLRKSQGTLQETRAMLQRSIEEKRETIYKLTKERDVLLSKQALPPESVSRKSSFSQSSKPNTQLFDPLNSRLDTLEVTLKKLVRQMARLNKESKLRAEGVSTFPRHETSSPTFQKTRLQQPSEFSSSTIDLSTGEQEARTDIHYVVVERGDTLHKLATSYGSTVRDIQKQNHLLSDVIYIGQELKIPVYTDQRSSTTYP